MLLFLSGCGLFHKPSAKEEVWSKFGIDSIHFESCGPKSLSELHHHFGENIVQEAISKWSEVKKKNEKMHPNIARKALQKMLKKSIQILTDYFILSIL